MAHKSVQPQPLHDFLSHNWPLKFLALILAVLTFRAIRNVTGYEFEYLIPLEVIVPADVAILDQPTQVSVSFRGTRDDIKNLGLKPVRAVATPRLTPGQTTAQIRLRASDIHGAGAAVRVASIQPSEIMLTLDTKISKTVRVVKPLLNGSPRSGHAQVQVDPETVIIRGPASLLEKTEVVEAEPISVDGAVASFSRRIRLLPPAPQTAAGIEFQPAEVLADVAIVTETHDVELTGIPIMAVIDQTVPLTAVCDPDTASVFLHGQQQVLDAIKPEDAKVFVDCSGLDAAQIHELPVSVFMPPGLEVTATLKPATVKVRLELKIRD